MCESGGVQHTPATGDAGTPVSRLLDEIVAQLAANGVVDARTDAELIVGHVLGVTRGRIQALAILADAVSDDDAARIRAIADERARRVPLQHLTGRAPFRSIELSVGPGVFVPRPETETVAQFAIDAAMRVPDPQPIVVDLCTGSGALALSIAHEVPRARVWAVEKSREAHAWAQRNVDEWGDGRVALLLGDVEQLDALPELAALRGKVHVLVSNPPYVPSGMVPRDPEVRDHDPELALYSGVDGLDLIRVISRSAQQWVAPGGILVLEHAELQGRAIRELLAADGWQQPETHVDLTGRDRTTTAIR